MSLSTRIYLNNSATTWPKPEPVYDAVNSTMRSFGSLRRECGDTCGLIDTARSAVAGLIGAGDPQRVVLTPGCTYALNLAIGGLPWQPGDVVVISSFEHHAVSRPVRRIVRERGVELVVIPPAEDGPLDLQRLEEVLAAGRVRLVAMMMASNVTGEILPVDEVATLCRRHDALSLVDAAQTGGVCDVDVERIGCDMLALAGHKGLFGPTGVGALWLASHVLPRPLVEGGTGGDSGRHELSGSVPGDLEAGTLNAPAIAGLEAGVEWVRAKGVDATRAHEQRLCGMLIDGLQRVDGVTIYGPTDVTRRTAAISFTVDGQPPEDVAASLLESAGVVCRAGFHCAPMAHETIGTLERGGTIRMSPGFFTKDEEVTAAIEAVERVVLEPVA